MKKCFRKIIGQLSGAPRLDPNLRGRDLASLDLPHSGPHQDGSIGGAGLRPLRLLALATSRAEGRSSAGVHLVAALATARGADVTRVDARDLPLVFPDQDPATFPAAVQQVVELARAADVVVVGGPVVRAAAAGFTRHCLELLRDGLKGAVVVPVLAAGSARSTLVGNAIRGDLLVNFEARPVPAILVSPELDDAELAARVDDALTAALGLVAAEAVAR